MAQEEGVVQIDSSGTYTNVEFDFEVKYDLKGQFTFKILKDNTIEGSGSAQGPVEFSSSLGSFSCYGKENISSTEYVVDGSFDPLTDKLKFQLSDPFGLSKYTIPLKCGYDYGDVSADPVNIPSPFNFDNQYIELALATGMPSSKKITLSGEFPVQLSWKFTLMSLPGFESEEDVKKEEKIVEETVEEETVEEETVEEKTVEKETVEEETVEKEKKTWGERMGVITMMKGDVLVKRDSSDNWINSIFCLRLRFCSCIF